MIHYSESTVFNVGAQTLVNTVNTTGTMGAGIALEFALRYPDMFDDYKEKCESKTITTGKVDYYHVSDGTIIVNFPTKQYYAYPSKLIWIEQGLQDFVETYKAAGVHTVAFPKLGCSNGKLSWNDVKPLMIKYLEPLDIDIYICSASKSDPEGIEKIMVDAYNSFVSGQNDIEIKLSEKQLETIMDRGRVRHFYEIRDIPGIKGAPYKRIFNTFYSKANTSSASDHSESSQYDFFSMM